MTSKIIFHASTLGIPERQQLGRASLSAEGFHLELDRKGDRQPVSIQVPLQRITNLRALQKKTYSSIFYVVQVDYQNEEGNACMVACEIRVFLRRGQALAILKAWKDLYKALKE
jgi:hypothetical protein